MFAIGVAEVRGSSLPEWGWRIGLAAVITGTSILHSNPNQVGGEGSTPPSTIAFGRMAAEGGASATEQVFLERPDGTTTQLTHGPDSNTLDGWSPDGSQLLVTRTFADGSGADLYAVPVDGSSEARLTADPQMEADAQWSPDGSKIAFRSGREISVMNADGTNVQRLTSRTNDLPNTFTWSPDGSRIAFISAGPSGNQPSGVEIDVANADGTGKVVVRRPTPPNNIFTQLAWSPDGSKIVFAVGNGHSTDIALMDADGKNVVPLSSIQANRPIWSPDGSKISVRRGRRRLRGRRGRRRRASHLGIRNGIGQLVARWICTRALRQRGHRDHEARWHGPDQDRGHRCARDEPDMAAQRIEIESITTSLTPRDNGPPRRRHGPVRSRGRARVIPRRL